MHIVFVIKAMTSAGGGAERVLASLASGLADRGHVVTLITNDPPDKIPFYPLSPSVRKVFTGIGNIDGPSGMWELLHRIFSMRMKLIKIQPDVVVAFMHSSYVQV